MAFNPAAAAAFNAQLLAASQPSTPVKTEQPSTLVGNVPVATSISSNNADEMGGGGGDTTRFLNASGPLLTPGGLAGFPHPMEHEAAFRAAMAQGALPFPAIYPGLHPAEMKPEMIGAVRAVSGYFFDPMPYHPYASGLDGTRRKNATRETTAPLKSWLNEHRKNPYPTKAEKIMLALLTKMTLTQVSTWFANARRRLKKENKMTWSPRNRPGDDDDDDLGDIDASSEQNHSDRPCSSASDGDISVVINDTSEHDASGDIQSKSITPPLQSSCSEANINLPRLSSSSSSSATTTTITPTTTTTSTTVTTPRKTKIWSIAETLSSNTGEANSSNNCCIGYGSNKDDYERASTSVERKSWNDDQESMVQSDIASTMININQTIPSSSSSSTTLSSSSISQSLPLTSSLLPPNASTITAINGQIPHHFLQFHPWQQQQQQHQHHQHHHQQHHHHHQQQQLAMAMAIRMPFPRPELLTMMAQAGHIRSPMLFNPMFMGAIMPGISTTNHPIHSTHLSTTQSNNTLLTNGPISQWRTPKSAATSPITPVVISPSAITPTTTTTTTGATITPNERMIAITTNNNNNNNSNNNNNNNNNSNNNHSSIDCDDENSPNDSKRSKSSDKSWENSLY